MVKQKIRLSLVLILLGITFLTFGSGIVSLPLASIVSVESPVVSVKAEGLTPQQAGSIAVGAILLIVGVFLYHKGK